MGEALSGIFGVDSHTVEIEYNHMFFFKMFDEGMEVWKLDIATGEVGANGLLQGGYVFHVVRRKVKGRRHVDIHG